jgi:hypothetical protein
MTKKVFLVFVAVFLLVPVANAALTTVDFDQLGIVDGTVFNPFDDVPGFTIGPVVEYTDNYGGGFVSGDDVVIGFNCPTTFAQLDFTWWVPPTLYPFSFYVAGTSIDTIGYSPLTTDLVFNSLTLDQTCNSPPVAIPATLLLFGSGLSLMLVYSRLER